MAYRLFTNFPPQFLDSNGDPLASGTLTFELAGTSTAASIYSDEDGTAASSPLTLDARGEITTTKNVWGDETIAYKITLKDSGGSTVWTQDDVYVGSGVAGSDAQWITQTHTPTRLTNTTFELATADGDVSATYPVGTMLQLTDAATIYAEVSAVDYNVTSTDKVHLTVINQTDSAGATSNLSASLSTVKIGIIGVENSSLNLNYVDIRNFGIVADGSTDQATILTNAIAYCATHDKWLYIPKFTSSIALASQVSVTCNIFGEGTIKTTVKIGNGRSGVLLMTASDITMRGLTFDCNSLSGAVTIDDGVDDGVIEGITSNNAYRSHVNKASSASGTEAVSNRWTIRDCVLTNAGQVDTTHGDGMYFAGCHDFNVYGNTIDGYTRIGITFEGYTDADHYSDSPLIHDNVILNGLNSVDASVPMSGIWCENTNGSTVYSNTITSVSNTAQLWQSNGITTGGFRDGVPTIIKAHKCFNNVIDDSYIGIRNPGIASGNSITNFKTGIYFSSGFTRGLFRKQIVRDTYFGYSTFDYDGDGAIYGGGSAKYPNCLFLFNSGSNADILIDGATIEGITKDAGETLLADIFFLDDPGTQITGTTISFVASDNSVNDTGAGLGALVEGDTVTITGSGSNNYTGIVKSQTSTSKVILTDATTVVDESVGASVVIDQPVTLGTLTIKNVLHSEPDDQGIVFRNEAATRVREVRFENCRIDGTLGSMPRARDLIEYRNCTIVRNSPTDITTRCKKINIIDCEGLPGGRYHSDTATGTIELRIQGTRDDSGATQALYNSATVFMHDNTFDAFAGSVLDTNASYTTTVVAHNNTLINNSGGFLVDLKDSTDVAVFNANNRDDATAIYVDSGTATITENNTTQI